MSKSKTSCRMHVRSSTDRASFYAAGWCMFSIYSGYLNIPVSPRDVDLVFLVFESGNKERVSRRLSLLPYYLMVVRCP